jgi:ATPase family associated with various cellular activities (AAA)
MMDPEQWQEQNTKYLAAAVAEVRARLSARAGADRPPQPQPQAPVRPEPEPHPPEPVVTTVPERKRSFWRRPRPNVSAVITTVALPPAPPPTVSLPVQPAVAAPESPSPVPQVAQPMTLPPALVTLSARLGLSNFEQEILLLCAAMEFDTGIAGLCARAQGDSSKPYPTFALALTLFDDPSWDALSPERPLRYWRLLEINQPGGQPLTTSLLRADERIVNYLKGMNYLDDRLVPLLSEIAVPQALESKPQSQLDAEHAILAHLNRTEPPAIELTGRDTPTKELIANSVAGFLSLRLFRIPAGLLPAQAAEMESFARLWQRESLLLGAALYVDAKQADGDSAPASAVKLLVSRMRGVVFVDARDAWGRAMVVIETAKPTAREQQALWEEALGSAAGDSPAMLAAQFNLGASDIHQIAQEQLEGGTASLGDRLWARCLTATRPRLDGLAQSIEAKAAWADIVLPPAEMALLEQIAAQVSQRTKVYEDWRFSAKMSRGLGISALFAGESGTGKTMAAEVLASYLKLNLHRVDLSSVVSKYIGETEKNLRQLFDAAEDGGAILFFDEADALFGKRSEVKDSHDRYANIEVNYLLQRMEAYRGLAILATNKKSALDQAFVRRLRFIVKFPFPGVAERQAIWQRVFPAETPTTGIDFARLSKLNLTGGHIHNIALNAAFSAAKAGTPVDMKMTLDAAREEFRKIERPVNESDFRFQGAA